ncbi:MAG: M67 family metallopeptidase [Rhizomicrobium sp.]
MSLNLTTAVLADLIAHARQDAPVEVCGYIGERNGVASRNIRLTNADASPEHFTLVPAEQFAAVKALRANGYSLRAVYHSHPASPARLSEEDKRLLRDPNLSYVIVSLAGAEPVVKSFRIGADAHEEKILVAQEEV